MITTHIPDLWRKFTFARNETERTAARDALICHYLYLVKITAGRILYKLPPNLERDDLVSAGVVGLIKAIDQYDATRQVKFETYGIALIRGAILEMLREDDWVPRSVRERIKRLEQMYLQLEIQFGRPATEDEMACELGLEPEEFYKLLLESARTSLASLEDIILGGSDAGEKLHIADILHDEGLGPSLEAEIQERRRILGVSIDRLPKRERLVITLYYYEGLTFREVGRILTISESRVYQLHTQAVLRLHGYLQRFGEL